MSQKKEKQSLEGIMERLGVITETMERENLPLDEMMALYKEGKLLEKEARERLNRLDEELKVLETEDADKE